MKWSRSRTHKLKVESVEVTAWPDHMNKLREPSQIVYQSYLPEIRMDNSRRGSRRHLICAIFRPTFAFPVEKLKYSLRGLFLRLIK